MACDITSEQNLGRLAGAILEQDAPATFEALAPFLSATEHRALADMLELCATHGCDAQICRDDGASCQEPR